MFGIRSGTEEPAYRVVAHVATVEIRQYGPRIAAQTEVAGEQQEALRTGFQRLAGYIFGGNKARTSIAMTAPVVQAPGSETIAMTAPVTQTQDASGQWVVQFFMPAQYTLQTLPVPDDPTVKLVEVPSATVAVLRFSGFAGAETVRSEQAELLKLLDGSAWHPAGAPQTWYYDPPWTLPFLRRNEVLVPVEG